MGEKVDPARILPRLYEVAPPFRFHGIDFSNPSEGLQTPSLFPILMIESIRVKGNPCKKGLDGVPEGILLYKFEMVDSLDRL